MLDRDKRRYIKKAQQYISMAVVIVLSAGAIWLGTYVGDRLAESDNSFIKKIDTEKYKQVIVTYFPLIDFVYNSGNISVSFTGELKSMIKDIFGFDLERPETVLNSNIILLSDYYPIYESKLLEDANKGLTAAVPESTPVPGETPAESPVPTDKVSTADSETGVHKETETGEDIESTPLPEPEDKNTATYGKVTLQQLEGTSYKLDIPSLLKEPLKLKESKNGPRVLIYHTHTTEAYLKNTAEFNKNVPTRVEDERYNVVAPGDELAKLLKAEGIGVIHNGTNHLAQGDVGAYARSLNTINSIIKGNPSIAITLDIHRDGYGEGKKLRLVADINGKKAAKIMFVVGTNYNLEHPNWKENLKLALKLQKYLEDNYPGITRPTYISANRYNEHVTNGSLIVEVGGDGNTAEEATESMKYLAKAIAEIMK